MLVWTLIFTLFLGIAGLALLEFAPSTRIAYFIDRQLGKITRQKLSDYNNIEVLTADDVALIEKILPNLKSVAVLCNKIDPPNIEFKKAVLDNFEEGVAYSFFVSKGNSSKDQLELYRDTFSHLHAAACSLGSDSATVSKAYCRNFDDSFQIGVLPIEWQNVPYIFYGFSDSNGKNSTIAYKGIEPGVGISSSYVKVPETEARAILELCSAASVGLDAAFTADDVEIIEELPERNDENVVQMPIFRKKKS